MDGWWNEEETFYPFEETPEEDDLIPEEEPQNPFTPISVADRFDQAEQRPHTASKSFAPPKPGQLYGQAFSSKPMLTPAKPFSQIQQGDLYGYTAPDDQPIATTPPLTPPPVSYPPMTNPFGAGVGASPLGAATPDTLPTFTARTAPVRRSDHHQNQPHATVPVWSIDDDPVPFQTASAGDSTSPYPGFPPLPQTSPVSWQQSGTAAFPPTPAAQPPKGELDWSLPDYPEADPNWKPAEGETPEIPAFLLEEEPAKKDSAAGESDSPMEKLNIPAYLRIQPLPRKKPRPETETKPEETTTDKEEPSADAPKETPEVTPEATPADAPSQEPPAAMPFPEEKPALQESSPETEAAVAEEIVYGDEIFMRPKTECPPPQPSEEAYPEADSATSDPLETLAQEAPVVLTPAPRRTRRSRMEARRELAEEAPIQEPATEAEEIHPTAFPTAEQPVQASEPRKRRSRRDGLSENPLSEEQPSAVNSDPFVQPVGAEDIPSDPPAVRPALQDIPAETASPFYLPVNDEEEPAAMPSSSAPYSFAPAMDIDGEDDWRPFDSGDDSPASDADDASPGLWQAPLLPDNPFAVGSNAFTGIPAAEDEEWSLFAQTPSQQPSLDFTQVPVLPDNPFATDAGNPPGVPGEEETEWFIFGSPTAEKPAPDPFLPPMDDDLFSKDPISNLDADESPLFGTSSYDAGDMPNPGRGNLPYGMVSQFDTGSRTVAPPEEPSVTVPPDAPETDMPNGFTAGYDGPLFPPVQQPKAKPLLSKDTLPPKPQKPPINPVRLILLVLAVAMAVFCIIAGTKMLLGYVRNTEEWSKVHQTFVGENGVSMDQAGETVQLPLDGSTFAPASTPVPAIAQSTVIPGHDAPPVATDDQQPTATPVRRTKIMQYPGNELRNILPEIAEIRKEYPEIIGKLVIPGVLEEWIMYRNNTYYLNHNYRGTSAEGGAVFMDTACTLETPPENLHLRGSGSVPGKTFHALWQYKTGGMNFINNAEVAHVTTLYEEAAYLLLAVIETSGDPSQFDYFNYISYPTFATDEEMLHFAALAQQHSLYNLPTDIQPGDRLLTLSTVTGSANEQSTNLVLIFRSMR